MTFQGSSFGLGDVALALAHRGLAVHPLAPGGKEACTSRGTSDATTDERVIKGWWHREPHLNIGINAGRSGLVFLDCDVPKPGKGWPESAGPQPVGVHNGMDAVVELAEAHGQVGDGLWYFDVPTVITPSGGQHRYYRAPKGVKLKQSIGGLRPWVDVKPGNSYVVAPFCWTRASERSVEGYYKPQEGWEIFASGSLNLEWDVVEAHLDKLTIAPPVFPEWLTELLTAKSFPTPATVEDEIAQLEAALELPTVGGGQRYFQAALQREADLVAACQEGGRNHQLNRSAYNLGTLIPHLDEATIVATLTHAARQCGLGDEEIRITLASGIRSGKASPRVVSPGGV